MNYRKYADAPKIYSAMRILLAAIILSFFLPVFIFAAEPAPQPSPAVSFSDNFFDSLRNISLKIESYITPESAKEKGFWAWIRESADELFRRAIRMARDIANSAENKARAAFDYISIKAKEKIGENIRTRAEIYIKNSIDYIDNKIKN